MLTRTIALLSALMLAGCATTPSHVVLPTVAYPFDAKVLTRDDVASCSEKILDLSMHGRAKFERAAFLLINDTGKFDCKVWPADYQFHKAQWWGATPDGTVAVVHSHPRNFPDPSSQDIMEAMRLQVPFIVVTPGSLTMAMPRDGRVVRVTTGLGVERTARN